VLDLGDGLDSLLYRGLRVGDGSGRGREDDLTGRAGRLRKALRQGVDPPL
jgi:hypothetical protein